MKKSILITLSAEKIVEILNGNIIILIQKIKPKCELPIDVYIYCAKEKSYKDILRFIDDEELNSKVIAKFTLNTVEELSLSEGPMPYDYWLSGYQEASDEVVKDMGMTFIEFIDYHVRDTRTTKKIPYLVSYAWYINDLVIFDKPKEIGEFYKVNPDIEKEELPKYLLWAYTEEELPKYLPLTKAPRNWKYIYSKGETK